MMGNRSVEVRLTANKLPSDHWYGIQERETFRLAKRTRLKRIRLVVKNTSNDGVLFTVTCKRAYAPAPKSRLRRNPTPFTKVYIPLLK